MIKDNQKYFNRLHVVLDAIIIAASYTLAWYLKFASPFSDTDPNVGALDVHTYFEMLYLIVPGYLILYYAFNLYTPKRATVHRYEILNIFQANTVGMVLMMAGWYMIAQIHFSRTMMAMFYGINIILTTLGRSLIRALLQYFREKGYNLKYILLVGYSRAAEEYIKRINSNPQWGYVVRGILDDHVPAGTLYKGVKVVGSIESLLYILPENKLDEIAITLSLKDYDNLEHIVDLCEKSGVHTKFIPDYNHIIPTKPYTEDLDGLPVIHVRHVPLSSSFNNTIKRLVDIFGSLTAIIIFAIPMIIVACIVKITSPGPLIFKQDRVGLHNREFKMYKFRSMRVQNESEEKKAWTTQDDPRVTPIGKFMRKTNIDELPQLFNVLKGDMSMVGPRPERPYFVDKFKEVIPRYMIKHQVRPGMTGWAQVNGYRGDTSITKRIQCDLYYVENWTLQLDFKILFLTFFGRNVNKNAY